MTIELDDIIVKDRRAKTYKSKKARKWDYFLSFTIMFTSAFFTGVWSYHGTFTALVLSIITATVAIAYWFYIMPTNHNIESEVGYK